MAVVASPCQRRRLRDPGVTARAAAFAGLAALGVIVATTRRPDAVSHPQFWAEDGTVWFADAYNQGWLHPLLTTHTGYYQTLARAVALLGQPLGVARAPVLSNGVAILLQILPGLFVASRRFERAIPSLAMRCVIGALYLAIPNFEVHANITNAQWHLAILAFMVVVAAPSPRWWWRAFDVAVLLLCALSGPFIILLAPIALAVWYVRRGGQALGIVGLCTVAGLAEGLTALTSLGSRASGPLGATPQLLAHILVNRVLLAGLLGEQGTPATLTSAWSHTAAATAALLLLGALTVGLALWRGPLELRLLLAFGGMVLLISLARPEQSFTEPQWPQLAAGSGTRYFIIPMVVWVVTLVWLCTRAPRGGAMVLTAALVLLFAAGDVRHWSYPAYMDLHPSAEAAQLSRARPGTVVNLPINPPGWVMVLQKHR